MDIAGSLGMKLGCMENTGSLEKTCEAWSIPAPWRMAGISGGRTENLRNIVYEIIIKAYGPRKI